MIKKNTEDRMCSKSYKKELDFKIFNQYHA